jgi:hypothetical protein
MFTWSGVAGAVGVGAVGAGVGSISALPILAGGEFMGLGFEPVAQGGWPKLLSIADLRRRRPVIASQDFPERWW